MSSTFISKITIKAIGANAKLGAVAQPGVRVHIADILGIATGTKVKEQPNGDIFTAITGQFEAVNVETGEVFSSGVLYLPGGIQESLESALVETPRMVEKDGKKVQATKDVKNDKGVVIGQEEVWDAPKPVQFKMQVYVQRADNPAGYSYALKNLAEVAEADPLAHLRALQPAIAHEKQAQVVGNKKAEKVPA